MNTYSKYCPNVFVVKCTEQHEKGEIITLETKYGKDVENQVHNYLGKSRDGFYLYSITRSDGLNSQDRAKNKADKLNGYAENAKKKSQSYYEASHEGRNFLSLGEPIKIGHHSEGRHRALIQRNWDRMGKSIAEDEKAKDYNRRVEYWEERANKVDLSMPESLNFFEFKLEEANKKHKFLLENPSKRDHSMSLQYANKAVKDLQINVNLAIKLWGADEEIKLLQNEAKEAAEQKISKKDKNKDLIKSLGCFFAFNTEQFKEGYKLAVLNGHLEEGEKVTRMIAGMYVPTKNVSEIKKLL